MTQKKRRWLHVPSPAMIVACVALFVALGGTSYAAIKLPAGSVGTKQLKSNAVTSAKVKDGTLTGADINEATLGQVPSAATAATATAATTATTVADGAVTTAKMGALPGAHVSGAGAATLVTSGVTKNLSFVTTGGGDFNVGGVYNATHPDRLTAPVAGKYLIIGSAPWALNAAGVRSIFLTRNTIALEASVTAGNALAGVAQQVQTVVPLAVGDYVQLAAFQDSGGNLNAGQFWPGATLSMIWIAP